MKLLKFLENMLTKFSAKMHEYTRTTFFAIYFQTPPRWTGTGLHVQDLETPLLLSTKRVCHKMDEMTFWIEHELWTVAKGNNEDLKQEIGKVKRLFKKLDKQRAELPNRSSIFDKP